MAKFLVNPITGNLDLSLNKASEIKYDNTTSGLTATDTQDAIDELDSIIDALPDPIYYAGTWDASTNTPTLANTDTGVEGALYRVNADGTVDFGAGNITFAIGDSVVNNGTIWEKWDHSDQVQSVNGQTGAVSLDTDDIAEGSALYFTDERAQDAAGALATSSAKVSLTYNDGAATLTPDIVADSLVNADINTSAAIDRSKLANGTANRVAVNNGSGVLSDAAAITAARALISDANGIPTHSSVTDTELGYVAGVTSAIQTQLDARVEEAVLTAKGDLLTATAASTPAALPVGTAQQILAANSSTSTGLEYVNNTALTRIEYILNPNALIDTTGYATYADAAGTIPVNGTGGSPTVTLTRNTTTPLRGAADFLFTKGSGNKQGEGFSYDFSIASADQGRVLSINFDYKIESGTYASGDLTVWVYDVTNAVLLPQPSGNSILNITGPSQQGQCTFQTASNSTSYRLIFHVSSVSANAYNLQFDNISVGPQVTATGYAATNWVAYTPTTNGLGTVSSVQFEWRRDGSDVLIRGKLVAGTVTAAEAQIGLPSVTSADTSIIPSIQVAGNAANNATAAQTFLTLIEPSVTYITFGLANGGASGGLTKRNGNTLLNSSDTFSVNARVPVAGWSSNVAMSTSANNRIVDFVAVKNGGSATANTTIASWTTVKDSVAAFNATTGVYTVQTPGDYQAYFRFVQTTTTNTNLSFFVNGVQRSVDGITSSNGYSSTSFLLTGLSTGDTVTVQISNTLTAASSSIATCWTMFLINGPQQIAASETIYFNANTSSTAGTAAVPYVFSVVESNSHGAYNVSTGRFTAPAPGFYTFSAGMLASSGNNNIAIFKNGVAKYYGTGITTGEPGYITVSFPLVAGDIVDVRPAGSTVTGAGSALFNFFMGSRLGGV